MWSGFSKSFKRLTLLVEGDTWWECVSKPDSSGFSNIETEGREVFLNCFSWIYLLGSLLDRLKITVMVQPKQSVVKGIKILPGSEGQATWANELFAWGMGRQEGRGALTAFCLMGRHILHIYINDMVWWWVCLVVPTGKSWDHLELVGEGGAQVLLVFSLVKPPRNICNPERELNCVHTLPKSRTFSTMKSVINKTQGRPMIGGGY